MMFLPFHTQSLSLYIYIYILDLYINTSLLQDIHDGNRMWTVNGRNSLEMKGFVVGAAQVGVVSSSGWNYQPF